MTPTRSRSLSPRPPPPAGDPPSGARGARARPRWMEPPFPVLADIDVAVVDVGPDPLAVGIEPLGHEVLEDPDDACDPRLDEPEANVDGRRPVTLERADLDRSVAGVGAGEAARCRRVDPLGVLLPAVEDVRLTDEAVPDEVVHVLHRGRVAEGQPDLGLELLRRRERVRSPDVLVVVADRLLHQAVLSGLERRERQRFVVVAARDDVDDIDVGPREHLFVVGCEVRHLEFLGPRLRPLDVDITDDRELDERRTLPSRKMREPGPPP